ncbi:MAG: PRC-barrel domain-containing protein [Flavisolibacter sp.]|jgi:sporulation protein YlmC with PRC-barrel domain|nr:PRC-barrel domain-containing protein [Flavisolibacter sp.]
MASDKKTKRLQELRGSGFEITDGQPDIRGWDVYDEEGRKIGKVDELIFDSRARKVRYMVLNILDVKDLELEKRTVVVPIGLAELDKADDHVVLHQVTPFQLRALPKYDKSGFGPKSERSISTVFGRKYSSHAAEEADVDVENDFYEHEHFDEENLQRRRKSSSSNNKDRDYNEDDKHIRQRDELNMAASNTTDETDLYKRQREQNLRDEEEIRRRNEENLRHEEELRRRKDRDN